MLYGKKLIKRILVAVLSVVFALCLIGAFAINRTDVAFADNVTAVTDASEVVFMNERQHFSVYFNLPLGDENMVEVEKVTSVTDNVLINGKSITEINNDGKNLFGESVHNGIKINVWANTDVLSDPSINYGLHFFIDDSLSTEYKLKLKDNDVLTFKSGFSINGVTFDRDISISYYESISDWKKEGDLIDTEKAEIVKVTSPVYYKEQELYYFYVVFENNPSDKEILMANYDRMMDNVFFGELSFYEINLRYGNDSAYVRFQTGTKMLQPYEDYLMYLHLTKKVVDDLGLNNQTVLKFGKDLRLPSLSDLGEDVSYKYDLQENFWVANEDREVTYHEVAPVDLSHVTFDSGSGNYYMVLYFDTCVSMPYMPQVNAKTEWLEAVYNLESPAYYYSNSHLQALIYDNIRNSVLDFMYINGKSIRQLQESETKIQQDQSICVNYCGAEFNETAIQILFNKDGDNAYNSNVEYTLEIKEGFCTPSHGKTTKDYTLVVGKGVVESLASGFNPYMLLVYVGVPIVVVGAVVIVLVVLRRRKNAGK
ncbi:MAG: hypothetical protein E7369_05605 [Clostridiales bacterium]|nr:hypothetical protein [Clostridiales bacterium]